MPTPSLLERFVEIIENSGLPQSRRDYWFTRIEEGNFDEQAFEELDREMKAHYAELDLAVRVKKAQIDDQKSEEADLAAKLLPLVQEYTQAQPTLLAEDEKTMKAEYMALYDEMMKELQTASTSQKQQDIEAIRKFLAQGKAQNDNAHSESDDENDDIQDMAA